MKRLKTITALASVATALILGMQSAHAQTDISAADTTRLYGDSLLAADSMTLIVADSLPHHHKRDWNTWRPSPKRALWLALVQPAERPALILPPDQSADDLFQQGKGENQHPLQQCR